MAKSAFDNVSGNLVMDQDLYALGKVTAGTPKVKNVKVPSAAVCCQEETQKMTATIKLEVTDFPDPNPALTIQVKNLTSGNGECFEKTYTALGFYEDLQIECFPNDILEYTFTYTNDNNPVSGDADFESAVLVNICD